MNNQHFVHDLDPIAFSWGDFVLPWYWLAYVVGFFFVYLMSDFLRKSQNLPMQRKDLVDMMVLSWLLLILGGRIFYAGIYNFTYFATNPVEILAIWKGGMSFHGGLVGALLGVAIIAKKRLIPFFYLTDLVAISTPAVIGLGRVANFINGELVGRVTDVPWAVVFSKTYDAVPRHPSQLYEALGEGLLLFLILFWKRQKLSSAAKGTISCYFLVLYGIIRFFLEFFRAPDVQLGYYMGIFTMGQLLSLAMVILGLFLYFNRVIPRRRV